MRLPLLPQLIDTYILSNFLFYLLLVLASFTSLGLIATEKDKNKNWLPIFDTKDARS